MKKKLYVLFSVLVVLFQFSIAQAQERLWWLSNGSIYSIRTDGTDYKSVSHPGDGIGTEVTGFSRSSNGITYVTYDSDSDEGSIGVLNGEGAVDIYDLCYTCPFGSEGITAGFNGRTYIPFRGGTKIHGVRIVENETRSVQTVSFSSTTLLADDFYLTATADGIFGLSKGYTGNYGMIYRLSENGRDILPIYYFTGGINGARPTGKLSEGTDGSLFGETYQGGKDNKGIYFKVGKDGSAFVKLGDIADGKRTDLVDGKYQILLNHIASGYKPLRDSNGFIYHSTPLGIFKINNQGQPVLKVAQESGFLVDLFDAAGSSAVKVRNIPSGATNVPVNTPFDLITVPSSGSYELQISTSPDFKTDVKSFNILYLPLTGVKLSGNTTYYARARAWSWPYYGEVIHFTTETVIDFSQERLWGFAGETIFSMKKDGSDYIVHQVNAGGFKELSDHHVLTTTFGGSVRPEFLSRIDREGMTLLYDMDYQDAYTVGESMVETSPGHLMATFLAAGPKLKGVIDFKADGTLFKYNFFSSTRDLRTDISLTATQHGVYGLTKGDANNKGFIYRVNDDRKGYTVIYQFQGLEDGKQPVGKIFAGANDFIFGQTQRGGMNNAGIYFKVKDDGTSFIKIGDTYNGEIWRAGAGGKYSNLERLINAGYPGVCRDSDGFYYVGGPTGILKITSDFYLGAVLSTIGNAQNLTIVEPAFLPNTMVSNIEDGAAGLPTNLTLRTDSFPGATHYYFELSTSPDFSSIDFAVGNTNPYAGITGLQANRVYYSRVRPNVWPYFGRVISFNTYSELSSEDERLVIRQDAYGQYRFSDEIFYTDKNGNNSVTLDSGDVVTEGRHVLTLSNGEVLFKREDELMKITKDGIVRLYSPLHWADHRWMQESWEQVSSNEVVAVRYNINTKQVSGFVKVKLDGSGIQFHPVHLDQFNGYSPKLTATSFGVYSINQGTGGSPGVIFRLKDDLSGIDIIHTFSGTSKPQGKLLQHHDGYFWGVTRSGGNFGGGVIYRIKPDGTDYQVLHHFAHNSGEAPVVGLLNGVNGWVYGVAREGGKDNKGVLFRIHEDFYTYEVIRHFADYGGQNPEHPLVMDGDWYIYGSVQGLGYFKTNLDGTFFTTIHGASNVDRVDVLSQRFVPNVQVVTPADQNEIPSGDAEFSLTEVPGATTYYVEISESPVFKGEVKKYSGTNTVQISALKPYTTYHARVRTNLLPFYGEITSFTTGGISELALSESADAAARTASVTVAHAYPNPSESTFTLASELKVKSIVVTDASGLVVYQNKNVNDTPSLQFGRDFRKGVYILKVVTDEGVMTSRLVKN